MSARPSKTQRMRRLALRIARDTGARADDVLKGLRRGSAKLSSRQLGRALARIETGTRRTP